MNGQSCTNGQQNISLQGCHQRHSALQDTNDKAANDINHHNDDGRNRITLDEFTGTIHRAIKIRFRLDELAALALIVMARNETGAPTTARVENTVARTEAGAGGAFFFPVTAVPGISRQHYDFGTIDWDEFWRVVGGDGPCNTERLAMRVKAWDDGAWVRDAALAYADKQHTEQQAA